MKIKSLYWLQFYEAIDLIINYNEDRFNQTGYKVYQTVESLLSKTCKSEVFDAFFTLSAFIKTIDDFDLVLLYTQLLTFAMHFQQAQENAVEHNKNLS